MALKLITAPTTYPVTQAEAVAHCKAQGIGDEDYLDSLITAATGFVEDYTGRAIMSQVWELYLDDFSPSILIPKSPVISVDSVKYYDTDSVLQTIDELDYRVDTVSDPQWLVAVGTWPTVADGINNVIIRVTAGYSIVPAALKQAILMLVGTWYDQRASTSDKPITETPHAVAALLSNHRSFAF